MTCSCKWKWYQCELHNNYGPTYKKNHKSVSHKDQPEPDNQSQPQPNKKPRKANKIKEYEIILADDIRIANNKRKLDQTLERDKLNNLVDLGTPSHLNKKPRLGPILNERFCRSPVNDLSLTIINAVCIDPLQSMHA